MKEKLMDLGQVRSKLGNSSVLHRVSARLKGAPTTPLKVTSDEIAKMWQELGDLTIRKAIRVLGGRGDPPGVDIGEGLRLPQVLIALAVLSEREQVVLVLSDGGSWTVVSPPSARICDEVTQCSKKPTMKQLNSEGACCRPSRKDIGTHATWPQELEADAREQRTELQITGGQTELFVNPGTLKLFGGCL